MATTPDFGTMSLDELRTWPAMRICKAPRVAHARGEKDEATKVLTVRSTWVDETTNFQRVLPERMMQTALDRWVWDGWTVQIKQELPWKQRRVPVVEPQRKTLAKSKSDLPPGFHGPEVLGRGRRRG